MRFNPLSPAHYVGYRWWTIGGGRVVHPEYLRTWWLKLGPVACCCTRELGFELFALNGFCVFSRAHGGWKFAYL